MDYIREELLRQRAALTRLLLGSGRNREEEEREKDPAREEIPSAEEEYFRNSRTLAALENVRVGRTEPAVQNRFWREQPEEMAEAMRYRERTGERVGEFPARVPETMPVYRRSYGITTGETAVEEMVSVVTEDMTAAAAEAVRAKELSRIFQRDARRYDGGFTLF